MMFLVDANVLSETTKSLPDHRVVNWIVRNDLQMAIDSIILGEISSGILKLPQGRKRTHLESWFTSIVINLPCIPWDSACALQWARLFTDMEARGITLPLRDSMIAATALVHGLTVVTRNTRDFKKAGVKVLDPFA